MTNVIRIAGAIASQTGITLYMANGAEMNLPNDSWKTQAIMDVVVAPLAAGGVVEVDLDKFSVHQQIENKTAGVITFIKKTMAQLSEMLADLEGNPEALATHQQALPLKEELVAVVKTKNGDVEIPGMDKMEKHIEHAAFTGKTKGLKNFMKRIAAVQGDRKHTVQELLNFMEKGDLPIADDGSIVAYKVLQSQGDHFVDCHTKKVAQKLGSRVSMDAKLVDPSRRTECSSGLHIARRGYLRGFGGDIITLVKVAPEDVIAVPNGEPNKMRTAAYHIVGVLPSEVHVALRSNKPMTGFPSAAKMLADVIAGNHVKVLEQVRIGEEKGGNVRTRELKANSQPKPQGGKNGSAQAVDDLKGMTPKDIREIARKAKEVTAQPAETQAERDARKKREKRAALKAAKEKAAKPVPADEARFHAFGNSKAAASILSTEPAKETKAERDARIKREKRALAKATREADIRAYQAPVSAKAAKVTISGTPETKAQRDARIKREKRAAAKAAKG